ncbi:MAG: RimK family alpha-L-glutamate ligase [Lachnospiraceae bacterium]|nr:RimK family alpha-L-glutamate ligase [Lachnospiraceae bacterium]
MKTGLLITNAYLKSKKYPEQIEMFEEAAKNRGIRLIPMTNADFMAVYTSRGITVTPYESIPDSLKFVLFWDKDVKLAAAFSALGYPVFNSASGIELSDDKAKTLEALSGLVRIPETIAAPLTFREVPYSNYDFLEIPERILSYPCIIKESYSSFGRQVYLANSHAEALEILKKVRYPFVFQDFIEESSGHDIRLQVVGNKVVAAILRYNDSDFRANMKDGGEIKAYTPSKEEAELAVEIVKRLGLDFAGVDLLFGQGGPILCEVNPNAQFKKIFECTGVNTADEILKYINWRLVGA